MLLDQGEKYKFVSALLMRRLWLNLLQASDMVSTSRILVAVVQMCYEAKDWDALNENIMLLTKRRSQLKQVRNLFNLTAVSFQFSTKHKPEN